MAGEPFLFTPAEIARLTDWQIDRVYLEPAVRRAEAMERERKGLPPAGGAQPLAAPPNREVMVRSAMSMFGRSRADAEADYDRQLAEWEKQRGDRAV